MKQLKHWQDAVNLVLGAWLALSPWVLGFSANGQAMLAAVATGIPIAALALCTLSTGKDYNAWQRERMAHY